MNVTVKIENVWIENLNTVDMEKLMATVQEVKDAVAAEAAEVAAKVDSLVAEIQALKDQIAAGTAATPEQLDEIMVAVQDIFTPTT